MGNPAFGHEVVDTTLTFGVARIPVLYRGILDLRTIQRYQLYHCRVQLVFITHRCGATLKVTDVGAFIGNDQRALELPGVHFIDAEIGRQLHRATHTLGDIHKGTVGKDRAVQSGIVIILLRHHAAEVLLHQLGATVNGLADRAENYTSLFQLGAKGGHDRD